MGQGGDVRLGAQHRRERGPRRRVEERREPFEVGGAIGILLPMGTIPENLRLRTESKVLPADLLMQRGAGDATARGDLGERLMGMELLDLRQAVVQAGGERLAEGASHVGRILGLAEAGGAGPGVEEQGWVWTLREVEGVEEIVRLPVAVGQR